MIPGPSPRNGKAILQYVGASLNYKKQKKLFPGKTKPSQLKRWEGSKLAPNMDLDQPSVYPVPENVDQAIVITTTRQSKNTRKNNKKPKKRKEKQTAKQSDDEDNDEVGKFIIHNIS
jgi:hypothetical protein